MTQVVEIRDITVRDLRTFQVMEAEGRFAVRPGDALECAAYGLTPANTLVKSVQGSLFSYLVLVDGELLATWGCVMGNPLSGIGIPWLLTTQLAESHKILCARQSRIAIDFLMTRFARLETFVAAEYLRSQLWLDWLGFQRHDTAVRLGNGTPFFFVYKERK